MQHYSANDFKNTGNFETLWISAVYPQFVTQLCVMEMYPVEAY